jgi:uncharacterized BrkB/YihY/UPF0761 family membrane protein
MNIYAIIALGGFIGIVLHILIAMQTINRQTPKATFNMVWKQYWQTDLLSFLISIVSFLIYIFILSEWIDLHHLDTVDYKEPSAERVLHGNLSTFIKTVSVIVGFFADYLVYKFIGRTKKVIDQKLGEEKKE